MKKQARWAHLKEDFSEGCLIQYKYTSKTKDTAKCLLAPRSLACFSNAALILLQGEVITNPNVSSRWNLKIIILENVTMFNYFCSNLILAQLKKNFLFCPYYLHVDKQIMKRESWKTRSSVPSPIHGQSGHSYNISISRLITLILRMVFQIVHKQWPSWNRHIRCESNSKRRKWNTEPTLRCDRGWVRVSGSY